MHGAGSDGFLVSRLAGRLEVRVQPAGPLARAARASSECSRSWGRGIDGPPEGAGDEPGLRWARSALDGRGRLLLALGDSPPAVSALLDQAAQNWSEFRSALS